MKIEASFTASRNAIRVGNLVAMCALATVFANTAPAQINSGMITGVVTDPQKAGVPNTKVLVIEDATYYSYSVATNGNGEYTVPCLTPALIQ